MSQGNRPGGLTALAVINFVFGGLGCLVLVGLFMILGAADQVTEGQVTADVASSGSVLFPLLFSVITVALLIVSGIGYLGLKKGMGFKMGNLYAVISIVGSIVSIIMMSQGFSIGNIIGFIYPAVTLFLLNTTFKEDFVN